MLSATEAAALGRGADFKRFVRAAAAMRDLFDDVALAEEVGVGRGAVRGWWMGAQPSPETLGRLARATGLSTDELARFVYYDGPPPSLPVHPDSAATSAARAGVQRDLDSQEVAAQPQPSESRSPQPRDTATGRE